MGIAPYDPSVCSSRSIHLPFQGRLKNSSALTGTSSIRGGFLLAPLQRSWQAVGLTEESRENDVRPYGWKFQVCGEQRTKNKNPPEGGTGGLSAVRKIVFLRWIGG